MIRLLLRVLHHLTSQPGRSASESPRAAASEDAPMAKHVDADHCTRHHTYTAGCRYNIDNASRPRTPEELRPGASINHLSQGTVCTEHGTN